MNKRISNIVYRVLLTAYISYLALPLVHYHPTYFGSKDTVSQTNSDTHQYDPFRNANSECSLNQIVTSHINEVKLSNYYSVINSDTNNYSDFLSSIPLQEFNNKVGLRAPPFIS